MDRKGDKYKTFHMLYPLPVSFTQICSKAKIAFASVIVKGILSNPGIDHRRDCKVSNELSSGDHTVPIHV